MIENLERFMVEGANKPNERYSAALAATAKIAAENSKPNQSPFKNKSMSPKVTIKQKANNR